LSRIAPNTPSQVFFGDILGENKFFPIAEPKKNSLFHVESCILPKKRAPLSL